MMATAALVLGASWVVEEEMLLLSLCWRECVEGKPLARRKT
jgi:hypothetical protein